MKCHQPASFVLSFDGPLNLMGESGNLQGFSSFRTDPEQSLQWNASMRLMVRALVMDREAIHVSSLAGIRMTANGQK